MVLRPLLLPVCSGPLQACYPGVYQLSCLDSLILRSFALVETGIRGLEGPLTATVGVVAFMHFLSLSAEASMPS